jgi:hypothetical protein
MMKTKRRIEALPDLDPVDAEAFTRAIKLYRGMSRENSEQVDFWQKRDGWLQAARYCAANCQKSLVRPKLWLQLPMYIEPSDIETIIAQGPDRRGKYQAARMLRKMLRAGLSRYEPQPIEALKALAIRRAQQPATAPSASTNTTSTAPNASGATTTAPSTEDPKTEAPVPAQRRA